MDEHRYRNYTGLNRVKKYNNGGVPFNQVKRQYRDK
jgi:hypothetical protein